MKRKAPCSLPAAASPTVGTSDKIVYGLLIPQPLSSEPNRRGNPTLLNVRIERPDADSQKGRNFGSGHVDWLAHWISKVEPRSSQ